MPPPHVKRFKFFLLLDDSAVTALTELEGHTDSKAGPFLLPQLLTQEVRITVSSLSREGAHFNQIVTSAVYSPGR